MKYFRILALKMEKARFSETLISTHNFIRNQNALTSPDTLIFEIYMQKAVIFIFYPNNYMQFLNCVYTTTY
jgi:hypothetical protein